MSSGTVVPIFDPQGTLRDVPFEQMHDAIANGGKPAVRFQAPDNSIHYVPADKTQEAVTNGGKPLPIQQQADGIPELYGFTPSHLLSSAWQGVKGTAQGAYAIGKDLVNNPNWVEGDNSTLHKFVEQPMLDQSKKAAADFAAGNNVSGVGHTIASGLPLVGPWAASLGEQAGGGDVGGAVATGSAQVATIATGKAIAHGAPALINAGRAALESPTGQAAMAAAGAGLKELPSAAVRRIPYVGNVAADTYQAAADAYKNSKTVIPEPTRAAFPRKPIWADKGIEAGAPPISVDVSPSEPYVPVRSQAPPVPAEAPAQPPAAPEQPVMGKRVSAKAVKQASALNPNATPQAQAAALKQPIADIVDQTIPPSGKTVGVNLVTKAKVEMALKQGDIEAATKALQDGADKAGLPAPKINEPLVPGSKADLMDDRHVEESIRAQYDQHGAAAWREMLREQADRNSMDTPKWERVAASRTGADPAARVPYPRFTEDLKDITDAPKAELAARQNFIAKHGIEPPQDLTESWQKAVDAIKATKK